MTDRPTVRPVTLARLVELTNLCADGPLTTGDIETVLEVSHRRARETILEAVRIGLLAETTDAEETSAYETTSVGTTFLNAVREEAWSRVSDVLEEQSPHYQSFLEAVADVQPATPEKVLERLCANHEDTQYTFNQTSLDVLGDWGERLGAIQRNAFTGVYYRVNDFDEPNDFPEVLLTVFEEREETAGVNLRQRYLPIPELREYTCERLRCTREVFDNALVTLVGQNVGKLELSGAPMDTGAKDAALGIKEIARAETDGLVSTDQSTDRVMAGVEQYGKQYYYLAVHDDTLTYKTQS